VIENDANSSSGVVRLPYVKPLVRNLDASETEGKQSTIAFEDTSAFSIIHGGPS